MEEKELTIEDISNMAIDLQEKMDEFCRKNKLSLNINLSVIGYMYSYENVIEYNPTYSITFKSIDK